MDAIFGRDAERATLLEMLGEGGPLTTFVHGPGGVGKSALLAAFADDARAAGARVLRLDCRSMEPTERGLLDAIGRAAGTTVSDVDAAATALASPGGLVALAIDTYEVFRISDTWLWSAFLPALADDVRVVVAGREPPLSAWFSARARPGSFRSMRLEPLDEEGALATLAHGGVGEPGARAINRVARGHPLALQVAVMAARENPDLRIEDAAIPRVVGELTRAYLEGVDAETRTVLDAVSVVRRATAGLLAAMLPGVEAGESLERLVSLAFVEETADGLRLHETVQEAISSRLRARDPEAYRRYRAAAWRVLRREAGETSRAELWRYTADMLYLIDNPAVREAFFPTTAHLYAVEPARPQDGDAIREIVERHETPESARVLLAWWQECPSAFRVVRDRAGAVAGHLVVAHADAVPYSIVTVDPVVAAWRDHLKRHPLPRGQRALFDRSELSRNHGSAPSAVQASTWLDIKRIYMEMRPHLGRLYSVTPDPTPFVDALTTLGFSFFPAPVDLGVPHTLAWLDFGPESVDGWLARLAAAELGVQPLELLDEVNRELVLDDRRVPLTPLEFGVMQSLLRREGDAVTRAALLEEVWGTSYEGGSNVVDVVVASLRKKLDGKAARLRAVRGVGYRFGR